jgi:hypothetical protein
MKAARARRSELLNKESSTALLNQFFENQGIESPSLLERPYSIVDFPRLKLPMSMEDIEIADRDESRQFTVMKDRYGEEKIRLGLIIPADSGPFARVRANWVIQSALSLFSGEIEKFPKFQELLPLFQSWKEDPSLVFQLGNRPVLGLGEGEYFSFPEDYGSLIHKPLGPGVPGSISPPQPVEEDEPLVEYPTSGLVHGRLRTIEELEDLVSAGLPITMEVLQIISTGRNLPDKFLNPLLWGFDTDQIDSSMLDESTREGERALMRKCFMDQFREDSSWPSRELSVKFYTKYFTGEELVVLFSNPTPSVERELQRLYPREMGLPSPPYS